MLAINRTVLGVFVLVALANISPANSEEVQLSPQEVRDTFIGTPWHTITGAFLFKEGGTYTYKRFDSPDPLGEWGFKMQTDGSLKGETTTYTFYRDGDSYRYYHSRSKRYFPAVPNRTFE